MESLRLQLRFEAACQARKLALEHGSIAEYLRALDRIYELCGAPLGRSERGIRIWIAYKTAVTAN